MLLNAGVSVSMPVAIPLEKAQAGHAGLRYPIDIVLVVTLTASSPFSLHMRISFYPQLFNKRNDMAISSKRETTAYQRHNNSLKRRSGTTTGSLHTYPERQTIPKFKTRFNRSAGVFILRTVSYSPTH